MADTCTVPAPTTAALARGTVTTVARRRLHSTILSFFSGASPMPSATHLVDRVRLCTLSHGPPAGRQPERMPRRGQLGSGSLLDESGCGECNAQGDTRPENQWQSLCYVLDGGQTGPFIYCASSSSYCPAGRPRGRQATALGAIRRQCRTLEQGDV
jgi:hypothetical protein